MKILAGAYTATSGEILIDGQPFHIKGPKMRWPQASP
jgi:ribose transport system ATP-binding protein